jgi:hypothetical protein
MYILRIRLVLRVILVWLGIGALYLKYVYIDQDEHTALMIAARKGLHDCLSILLAHGAEVDKATTVSVSFLSLLD